MEILRYIDANYSGILSVMIATMTALVTLVYVILHINK